MKKFSSAPFRFDGKKTYSAKTMPTQVTHFTLTKPTGDNSSMR